MLDSLIHLDKVVFIFINQGLSNQLFDWIMPVITDWDKTIIGRLLVIVGLILILWKGEKNKRILVPLLFLTILFTDQLSSSLIKHLVQRPRPCHIIGGTYVMENLRLLVPCGAGFSFPSSHAANSFAVSTLLTIYYPKFSWVFIVFALLVSFSRIYVGVHYPIDVVGGAATGIICSLLLYLVWLSIKNKYSAKKDQLVKQ
jgi:membrane-associated phospholipid phosphatase